MQNIEFIEIAVMVIFWGMIALLVLSLITIFKICCEMSKAEQYYNDRFDEEI